jgi:divalent metal cation (Fe/Co/Zn/Cd) transporter
LQLRLLEARLCFQTVASIRKITNNDPAVKNVLKLLTLHFGPQEILLTLEINFIDDLETEELEIAVERLESSIRTQHSEIQNIFIEAKSISARKKTISSEQ